MTPLTPLSALSSLGDIGGGSSSAQSTPAPASTSGPSFLSGELAKIVIILLGLILIVAGLFSFRPVQQVTGFAAKTAAAAAV